MKANALTKEQKLASRRGVLFGASLWLQDDHLLSVRNMRFTEEYRRYYYKDILAIQVRRAPRFSCPIPLLLGAAVLPAASFLFLRISPHSVTALCVVALAALLGYQAYLTFFGSCVCHFLTESGADPIPALVRLKTTRTAVKRIAERVEAAQGEWAAASESPLEPIRAARSSPQPSSTMEPLSESRVRKGRYAASLVFLGTLADAIITLMQSHGLATKILAWIAPMNLLMVLLGGVAAVMLLNPSKQCRTLRNAALACALFVAGISYTLAQGSAILVMFNRRANVVNLGAYHSIGSSLNIGGDLCLIVVAAVLMLRQRFRAGKPSGITTLGGI